MACSLNKFTTYSVGQIYFNKATGEMTMQLVDPPTTCPDKAFSTHNGELVVQANSNPVLTYDSVKNKPVLTVPNKDLIHVTEVVSQKSGWKVEEASASHGSHWYYFPVVALFIVLVLYAVYRLGKWAVEDDSWDEDEGGGGGLRAKQPLLNARLGVHISEKEMSTPTPTPHPYQAPLPNSGPTVINNNTGGGGSGLLTGIVIGEMLSSTHHDHYVEHERVVTHEVLAQDTAPACEPPAADTYQSNDFPSDTAPADYSSDSGSSFSSDAGSSFSSDSSSSF